MSYWKQFEQGVLTELAVQILLAVAEKVEDTKLNMVHAKDFSKHWVVHGYVLWLRRVFLRKRQSTVVVEDKLPPRPKIKFLLRFWKIATHPCFNIVVMLIIILNLVPITWELVRVIKKDDYPDPELIWENTFNTINVVFTSLYTLEFIIKVKNTN